MMDILPFFSARASAHVSNARPVLMRAAAATLTAAAVLLSGCASVTQPQKTAMATARASTVAEYQGRFSVRYADQNGQTRDAYGNFDWTERADAVTLQLLNPLGSTLAVIEATPTTASLELPNQPPRTASNVEDLMQSTLGFPMPVSGMRYWLRNMPSPESHARTTADANGRLSRIVQDGWQIDYLAFDEAAPPAMPAAASDATAATKPPVVVRRMNLVRTGRAADAPLEVKLVINP
jgi:outer membrane lipoprotein LolB